MSQSDKKEVVTSKGSSVEAYYGRAHRYKGSMQIINQLDPNARILDVGSGERRLNLPNVCNVDASKNKYIDIIVDAHYLPFRDNTFDLIICEHLLEHVKKPWVVIEEIYRITKIGGIVYIEVPFMTPYHGRPHHYFNMTKEGVEQLCEKFQKIRSGVQPYNMPSHSVAMILSRYLRCFLPSVDKNANQIEVYDTGFFVSRSSITSSFLMKIYNSFDRILAFFDRYIDEDKAQELAVATYYIGRKFEDYRI